MKKRGQVTLFIILGLVLLIIFSIFFYFKGISKKDKVEGIAKTGFDYTPIRMYIGSCFQKAAENSLWVVGAQGGYIDSDFNTIDYTLFEGFKVPYYMHKPASEIIIKYPALEEIEEKLSREIIIAFEDCIDFSVFEEMGFKIEKPEIDYEAISFDFSLVEVDVNVSINKNDVTAKLVYPLLISKGDSKIKIAEFFASVPINFKNLYDSSIILVNKTYEGWSYPDRYEITSQDCEDYYDKNDLTNLYKKDNIEANITQFVDFSSFFKRYIRAYKFQFAIKDINFEGGCSE